MRYFRINNLLNLLLGVWIFVAPWLIPHELITNDAILISWNAWIVVGVVISLVNLSFQNYE